MAGNSVSCACGGKNKKCFTCLVAGKAKPLKPPKTIPRVKAVHQMKQSLGKARESQIKYMRVEETCLVEDAGVACADCAVMVKDLEKHRSKVHGVMVVDVSGSLPRLNAPAKAPTNPLFTLQKCTVCGSMVRDIAKHMKKAKHIDEAKNRTLQVPQAEAGEMICPFCTSRWPNRTEVTAHLERGHGKHAKAELRFALPPEANTLTSAGRCE